MLSEADDFSAGVLRNLRRRYRGSALVASVVTDGLGSLEDASKLSGAESAVEVAALESFLADVLISVGQSARELELAQQLSRLALSRLGNTRERASDREKSLAAHTALLSAIASKAMGDVDAAFIALDEQERQFSRTLNMNWSDLIPLRRQRILMLQRADAFAAMAHEASAYRLTHPADYYATLKRVFEYLLNRRLIDSARTLFNPLRSAYSRAAPKLNPVAHISFLKNSGHFLVLDGYPRKGTAVLFQALRAAAQFSMHGQVRQINRLIGEVGSGSLVLEAFHV